MEPIATIECPPFFAFAPRWPPNGEGEDTHRDIAVFLFTFICVRNMALVFVCMLNDPESDLERAVVGGEFRRLPRAELLCHFAEVV